MGDTNILSRRNFLSTLSRRTAPNNQPNTDDPLFDRYARKTLSPRVFKTELLSAETFRNSDDANRIGNVTSGLAPYTGVWTAWEVLHLLRRTGYGSKHADVAALLALNPSQAVDAVFNIDTAVPAPPVNWYNNINADEDNVPYGADWTNSGFASATVGQRSNINRSSGLARWLFGHTLNSDRTIREKMTLFWYHLIPIDFLAIYQSNNQFIITNSARVSYQYFALLRSLALGNFKTIIKGISTAPAMMYYLNNNKNTSAAPDENFARELFELFTLGKGADSLYTQDDVVAASKALTGWRVNGVGTATITTAFDATKHTQANKQFSSFFNNTVIVNQPGAAGATELDALINMIFTKTDVVSKFLCRRLYRFFVYYDIDANIEANVIGPLAQTLIASNWDLVPVLKKLFKSEHFFDMANRGVMIKPPFDLVAGSLRSFGVTTNVSSSTNYEAQYRVWNYFNDTVCRPMEQTMGDVPNVSGWVAYYQSPAFYEYWINSNTVQKRFKFLTDIYNGFNLTYNGLTTRIMVDPIKFVQQFPNATIQDPNKLVAACIQYLLPVNLSIAQQASLKGQTLLSGQTTDGYWTSAWLSYLNAPTNAGNLNIVTSRLKSLLLSIVQLAEFQLM